MSKKTLLLLGGGCVGLILLCCIAIFGITLLAPSLAEGMVEATATGRDESLTRFEDREDAKATSDKILADLFGSVKAEDGYAVSEFSEKQMLTFFIPENLDDEYVDDVGIAMTPGEMKVQFSSAYAKALAELPAADSSLSGEVEKKEDLKCKAVEDLNLDLSKMDLYPTFVFEVENGKDLKVKSISFGSTFLDSLCEKEIKEYAENNFSNTLNDDTDGEDTTVEILEDKIVIKSKISAEVEQSLNDPEYNQFLDSDFDLDEYLKENGLD